MSERNVPLDDLERGDDAEDGFRQADPGEEGEDDLRGTDPVLLTRAVVTSTDWTTETILSQLSRGNITLDPRFQRRDAWKVDRKSRFIESLILGLPVPQIVLAERPGQRGSYIVIDGKQRLLTLSQFCGQSTGSRSNAFPLTDLSIRADLNNVAYADLQEQEQYAGDFREFQNQTIRTVVVRSWHSDAFLYTVFLRLNTGSLPLSPQELRQALHPGPFVSFADEVSQQCRLLHSTLHLRSPDFRMRDVELVLRYYAFRRFLHRYSGNLKAFLDMTCSQLNEAWAVDEGSIREDAAVFEAALQVSNDVFGPNAFRLWRGSRFEGRFNRAVFDIVMYYFSREEVAAAAVSRSREVRAAFQELCS